MARSLLLLLSAALSLLSLLPVPCNSLTCIECKDTSVESCTGTPVICPKSNYVCVSTYIITLMGGIPISKMFMRECGDPASCHKFGSVSSNEAKIKVGTSCCSTDGCTPKKPSLPPDRTGENGIFCKSCVSTSEVPCQTDDYIQCTGEEVKCISQVTHTTGGSGIRKSSMRGCATKEMCEAPHIEASFGNLMMTTETMCSDGCAGLHSSLCLLFLTVILTLKFIT